MRVMPARAPPGRRRRTRSRPGTGSASRSRPTRVCPTGVLQNGTESSSTWTNGMTTASAAGQHEQRARAQRDERQGEQEQDRVRGQDHVHRAHRSRSATMPMSQSTPARTARRWRAARISGGASGRLPPVTSPIETPASVANRMDERPSTTATQVAASAKSKSSIHEQVRRDHADHGEPAREIHAGDALRAVQPLPAGAEPARRRRRLVSPGEEATPAAPSARAVGSRPRPTRRSAARR